MRTSLKSLTITAGGESQPVSNLTQPIRFDIPVLQGASLDAQPSKVFDIDCPTGFGVTDVELACPAGPEVYTCDGAITSGQAYV